IERNTPHLTHLTPRDRPENHDAERLRRRRVAGHHPRRSLVEGGGPSHQPSRFCQTREDDEPDRRLRLRDVSSKSSTLRSAKASAVLHVDQSTIEAIRSGNVPKADPLGVARVAGIQAAKQTSLLIPYCHQVPLDHIDVSLLLENSRIIVTT